jgi:phosphoglycerol geranylgeranyltransferase
MPLQRLSIAIFVLHLPPMVGHTVLTQFQALRSQQRKGFAVLIDPDNVSAQQCALLAQQCGDSSVDFIFFGGSLMVSNHVDECLQAIKTETNIPVALFPGSPNQVSSYADALLYLSLISGRNPDLLIGQHVVSAPMVRASGLEVISTGYMVVDGGAPTTVSYMSGSFPIPHDKNDIAVCTAMAGEMQGKHVIYMDAGSGAKRPISTSMIAKVRANIQLPIIVGGGITDAEKAYDNCKHGADIIVVGNAIEKDPGFIKEVSAAVHSAMVKA